MALSDKTAVVSEGFGQENLNARLFGIGLGLVSWIAIASIFPEELMPGPVETALLTWDLIVSGSAWTHLWATLWRTFWGFLGSVLLGVAIGVLMGINSFGQRFFTPYVIIGFGIPTIAWAAATTLIFGFSDLAPITATIFVVFPIIAINVWKGVEDIDRDLIEMTSAFSVSKRRLLFRMILPNTAPALFVAYRFGLATAWKIVTIAEMFASSNGIGYMIIQTFQYFQYEQAWAWAIVFMIVILLIEYVVIKPIQRKTFEYRQDADFNMVG